MLNKILPLVFFLFLSSALKHQKTSLRVKKVLPQSLLSFLMQGQVIPRV